MIRHQTCRFCGADRADREHTATDGTALVCSAELATQR